MRWNFCITDHSRVVKPGILTELFALKICINFSRSCNPKSWFPPLLHTAFIVTDRVPKIGFLGTRNKPKSLKAKLNRAFLHCFGHIFGIFDDF